MKLTKTDLFFLSLRMTVLLSLIYYLGLLSGIAVYTVYFSLNILVMKYLFGLEAVSPVDTLIVHDDDNNVANIISKES